MGPRAKINARRAFPSWLLPVALLVGLIPFYWVSFRAPAVGLYHDDGIYLVTAKALAEGKGYHIISLPDEPRQTKYPPGLPILLAAVWKFFPEFPANVPVLKLVPAGALLAWLGMAAFFAHRWGKLSAEAALWLVFLCAGTSRAIFVGTHLMSDLLFGALALGALHCLLKVPLSPKPVKTALAAAAWCAAGYFVRSAGVAVMAGGFIGLLAARRIRPALVFGGVSALAFASWVAWQRSVPAPTNMIERYYSAANYTDWNLITGHYSLAVTAQILWTNTLGVFLYPLRTVSNRGPVIFGLAAGWFMWAACVRGLLRSPELRAANLSFAIYVAMLLLYAWNDPDRFLLPFLPLLLATCYNGLPRALRRIPFAMALAAGIFFALAATARNHASEAPVAWGSPGSNAANIEQWIQRNTKPDSIIVADHDPAIYLYTGRRSIRAFDFDNCGVFYGMPRSLASKVENLREVIDKVRPGYIVWTGGEGDEPEFQELLESLVRDGQAKEVHRLAEDYAIYEISQEVQPTVQELSRYGNYRNGSCDP